MGNRHWHEDAEDEAERFDAIITEREAEIAELKDIIAYLDGRSVSKIQAEAIREMFKHCGAWAVLKDGTKELIDLDVDACVAHADKLEKGDG